MKKITVAATVILMGVVFVGAPATTEAGMTDLVVVDRSTRSKVLTDYTLLTRDAIQKAWKTPLDLRVPSALKGRIRINYTVTRSGALEKLELIKGSGVPEMDKSLVKAIQIAQPFPPFPDDLEVRKILIRANFVVAEVPPVTVTTVSSPVKRKKLSWGKPAGTAAEPGKPRTNSPVTSLDMVKISDKPGDAGTVAAPKTDPKKFVWGRPAGTARNRPEPIVHGVPAPPAMRKFEWGAGR